MYINDLNLAIKHCKVHHFADDTNLLYTNNSIKKLNKLLNKDLKNLTNWLNANKISLNVDKTEVILSKPTKKPLDCQLKLKLNGKRLYHTSSVKYLEIKIDQYLNWQDHINNIAMKLNKANSMLYKVRQFVNKRTLISIYHAIFDSHLNYTPIVWGRTKSSIIGVFIIQKETLRTIYFKGKFDHTSSLFSESNIIKLPDKIFMENCLFVSKSLNSQSPEIFNNWFVFSYDTHSYETSCSEKGMLKVKSFNKKSCGREAAVIYSAINT